MKLLLLAASLALVSISSMANHHKDKDWKKKWDSMSFEDAKKYKTEKLAMKKATIEEAQTCVDKTTDKKGIESCMDKMHDEKKHMHQDMMKKK